MRVLYVVLAVVLYALGSLATPAAAASSDDLFRALSLALKRGAKLSDDLPRSALDDAFRKLSRAADNAPPSAKSVRSAGLAIKAMERVEPQLIRQINLLPPAMQEAAINIYRGSGVLAERIPDAARRSRLLREHGADIVGMMAKRPDDAADAILRLDGAVRAGKLPANAITDFGQKMSQAGDGTWKVWNDYIRPNWKAVVGTGLVTSFIVSPETYADAAGNLTEAAVASFAKVGVSVASGAASGLVQGVTDVAVESATGTYAWTFWIVLVALIAAIAVYLRLRFRKRSAKAA